jgi:hypothetical protein
MRLVSIDDTSGGEVHTGIWWGNLKERGHWEDNHKCQDNIKMYLKNWLRKL